jgi:hypothetical protein
MNGRTFFRSMANNHQRLFYGAMIGTPHRPKKAWSSAAAAESLAISIDETRARAQEKRRNPASREERSIQIRRKTEDEAAGPID